MRSTTGRQADEVSVHVAALTLFVLLAQPAGQRATPGSPDLQQETPPAFRTAVNLVMIDVQVAVAQGRPMTDLATGQFDVSIAGHQRKVVLAQLLHADEGPVTRSVPHTDAATRAACVFGFERSSKGANAHYLLGIEPSDTDKRGIKHPKVRMKDKALVARRWAWRSRAAVPPSNSPARDRAPMPGIAEGRVLGRHLLDQIRQGDLILRSQAIAVLLTPTLRSITSGQRSRRGVHRRSADFA